MKIDITKKYQTKNGNPCVIHGFNGPIEGRPVVYSRQAETGTWFLDSTAMDGTDPDGQAGYSLIEIREPREFWVNDYGGNNMAIHETEDSAAMGRQGSSKTIRVIRVREIL